MKASLGRMGAKEPSPPRKAMPAILWSWLGSARLGSPAEIYAIGALTPFVAERLGLERG